VAGGVSQLLSEYSRLIYEVFREYGSNACCLWQQL